jgi:hypothetical protein
MLFWNIAFMYWLTSKQLEDWIEMMNFKQDEDPEILGNNFTVKMSQYRKVDLGVKIMIFLLTLTFSASNVIQNS